MMTDPEAKLVFEDWARGHTQVTLTPAPEGCVHPDYYSGTTQRAWEAWQAAIQYFWKEVTTGLQEAASGKTLSIRPETDDGHFDK